nr:MAG TPA: hypothetical protein [Caudoviricetes sp.]
MSENNEILSILDMVQGGGEGNYQLECCRHSRKHSGPQHRFKKA